MKMIEYKYPHYYKQFSCIGGSCEENCCTGWQIVIDDESLERYGQIKGEFGWRLKNSINYTEEVFEQDEKSRCAFLNQENLCDIHKELGADALCYTCKNYPRHMEEYEGEKEMSLSLSCPEAARIILQCEEIVTFYNESIDEDQEEYEFDFLFYMILNDIRDILFALIQDRSVTIDQRMKEAMQLIEEVNALTEDDNLFEVNDILEKRNKLEWDKEEVDQVDARPFFSNLKKLEVLQESWPLQLDNAKKRLEDEDGNYKSSAQKFRQDCNLEVVKEQIGIYFLYTYFLGAVYDGEIYSKFMLAYTSIYIIEDLCYVYWLEHGKLENAEIVRIAFRYAREIEHSDTNLIEIDEIYSKNRGD